jgi:mono/diheme cytochrome c family protein
VWFWAIEWTFFAMEIAAALVYYYGWDRLTPETHLRVGWVYAFSAWMSLVVINGILTFMLTPGAWPETRSVWDAFFNPTYWPALVARTFASVGLAGLYALLTASWMADGDLKRRLAVYAGVKWVLPMAIALPVSLAWYLWAAAGAGVPVGGVFGAAGTPALDAVKVLVEGSQTGHPIPRYAALASIVAGALLVVLLAALVLRRPSRFGPAAVAPLMLCGLVTFGGAEFVREGLRKPYVIGQFMFVNGVRLPGYGPPATADAAGIGALADRHSVDAINRTGVLAAANYVRPATAHLDPADAVGRAHAEGQAVFTLLCHSCHTMDGYLAIRPLVQGRTVATLEGVIAKLALPVDGQGAATDWSARGLRLATWRDRQMPPFAGTDAERHALAVFLALEGGASKEDIAAAAAAGDLGKEVFDANCAICHGDDAQWPIRQRPPRPSEEFLEMLGRLPQINELMPPFEGDTAQRAALAAHLAALAGSGTPSTEAK